MNPQRFEELLPWYVNGTLNAEDRAAVEAHLQAHPEAEAELAWFRSLSARIQDDVPAVPETIGLARAMTLIRGDRPTFSERVGAFFGGLGMRPAAAFAGLAIVAVQGAFILNLLQSAEQDAVEMRSLRASAVDDGPMLKINFAPEAKEAEIRHLLISVQGRLAGGPGQLGDYYIAVPPGREAAAVTQVQANPIVQAVTLAPGLPPRGE
jgi:hypothetical protein